MMASRCNSNAMQPAASGPDADAATMGGGEEHLYSISGMSEIFGCSSQPSPQLRDATSSAASCTCALRLPLVLSEDLICGHARIESTASDFSSMRMPGFSVSSSMQS